MAIIGSNIFQNPAIARYLDYAPDVNITDVPFAGDVNIPFEGRTKPVTDISEIAPTGSTQSVLAEGIANAAYRVDNTKTDWTKPFSTLVRGSGQPDIRSDVPTYDYSGYKLGNPEEGWKGMGKEIWETAKTVAGGHAPNIIANTLGDYTVNYTPGVPQLGIKDVMNLYDRYDFVGKMGEGMGSAYDIDIDLPPELLAQIKNYPAKRGGYKIWRTGQIMNRRKKAMQQEIRKAEKREKSYQDMIKKNIPTGSGGISNINIQKQKIDMPEHLTPPPKKTYVSPARPHGNGGGRRPDKPGGFTDPGKGSYGPHMAYGGRASYFDGGLLSLWPR